MLLDMSRNCRAARDKSSSVEKQHCDDAPEFLWTICFQPLHQSLHALNNIFQVKKNFQLKAKCKIKTNFVKCPTDPNTNLKKEFQFIETVLWCICRGCRCGVSLDTPTAPGLGGGWRVRWLRASSSETGLRCWLAHTGTHVKHKHLCTQMSRNHTSSRCNNRYCATALTSESVRVCVCVLPASPGCRGRSTAVTLFWYRAARSYLSIRSSTGSTPAPHPFPALPPTRPCPGLSHLTFTTRCTPLRRTKTKTLRRNRLGLKTLKLRIAKLKRSLNLLPSYRAQSLSAKRTRTTHSIHNWTLNLCSTQRKCWGHLWGRRRIQPTVQRQQMRKLWRRSRTTTRVPQTCSVTPWCRPFSPSSAASPSAV